MVAFHHGKATVEPPLTIGENPLVMMKNLVAVGVVEAGGPVRHHQVDIYLRADTIQARLQLIFFQHSYVFYI